MFRIILSLILLSLPAHAADPVADKLISGPATYIVDGDTLDVGKTRVRLWGINTPERGQPGYKDAKEYLRNITANATLNCMAMYYDYWKRTVASCEIEGQDVGRLMVLSGMAIDYKRYSKGFYGESEAAAKASGAGLWKH